MTKECLFVSLETDEKSSNKKRDCCISDLDGAFTLEEEELII